MSLTQHAHQLIRDHFMGHAHDNSTAQRGIAIDATCGNGHDTAFLLELDFTHVLAFDVQEQAIAQTRKRCANSESDRLRLVHASHDQLQTQLQTQLLADSGSSSPSTKLDCVMFNLGYLPRGDKTIATQLDSTIDALTQACSLIASGGLITVLCYPGHPAGFDETAAVIELLAARGACDSFTQRRYDSELASATTPVLLTLEKH